MGKPLIATKHVSTVAANLARLSIASGGLFVALLLSLHVLEPEFDPTRRFVSEYVLGSVGWLMVVSQVRTWPGYIGLGVLALAACGLLLAAIFTTDPITASPAEMKFSGQMHLLGASLDYSPVAAVLLSWSLARNRAWRTLWNRMLITAAITLVMMFAFIAALPFGGEMGPGGYARLVGRVLLVSYLGWIVTVGLHALRLHEQTHDRVLNQHTVSMPSQRAEVA